jgi:hypothetical protein
MHDDRSKENLVGDGEKRKPYVEDRWWMNSNIFARAPKRDMNSYDDRRNSPLLCYFIISFY